MICSPRASLLGHAPLAVDANAEFADQSLQNDAEPARPAEVPFSFFHRTRNMNDNSNYLLLQAPEARAGGKKKKPKKAKKPLGPKARGSLSVSSSEQGGSASLSAADADQVASDGDEAREVSDEALNRRAIPLYAALHSAIVEQKPMEEVRACVAALSSLNRGLVKFATNNMKQSYLHTAVRSRRVDATRFFLYDVHCDLEAKDVVGHTAAHLACRSGDAAVLDILLEAKASVNARDNEGKTLLHMAAVGADEACIRRIAELAGAAGPNVSLQTRDAKNLTALNLAVMENKLSSVQLLLELKALVLPANDSEHPFLTAAYAGHVTIAQYLLASEKLSVNLTDRDKETALHWAALGGRLEMVKFLLNEQADVNARDFDKRPPLMLAAKQGHLTVVKWLVEEGKADVSLLDEKKQNVLEIAAQDNRESVVRYLLQSGTLGPTARGKAQLQMNDASKLFLSCYVCLEKPGGLECSGCQQRQYCSKVYIYLSVDLLSMYFFLCLYI
jgi:ankyrin repeat protein